MEQVKKISANVFYNDKLAGVLTKEGHLYTFSYDQGYLSDAGNRPVSITMPLRKEAYKNDILFPVFVNMLSEGANKGMQSRLLKIDGDDYFSLLLATATLDSIGAITIKSIDESV
jgi:serine/threonine-protein kinase HipA